MSIEFKCSGCGNSLRVPDGQAGRQAKCPVCQQLTTIPSASAAAAPVESSVQPEGTQPVREPVEPVATGPGAMRPHRGVSVLVFGICSVFCCGLLGIAPRLMANEDLALMDRGLMDPTGRGMTMAGKVLGIIGLVLLIAGVLVPMALRA